jgi:uncharacterized glyoxalase superfamily protein PhnB
MQLDEVVQAMLISLPPRPEESPSRDLPPLLNVARELRDLPRGEFRAALKSELQRRASMNEGTAAAPSLFPATRAVHYMRPGFSSITPYILVKEAARFIEFLKSAFQGTEKMRVPEPDGTIMHAEVAVGNGMIEIGDANEVYPARPMAIHLYVDDSDATYERAVQAGAAPIYPMADQPWGDRQGAVKDQFGNHWYIAMVKGWTPGPEGLRTVQPYLHLRESQKMIPFVEAAFGAEALGVATSPEGAVLHATIRIGNATLEIDEEHGEFRAMPCYLHVYVPDVDEVYARALRAGAAASEPPADKPYGDRAAAVKDPFGNSWFIATYLGR